MEAAVTTANWLRKSSAVPTANVACGCGAYYSTANILSDTLICCRCMSQDDRQNFFAHDYDDLNEDEFCVFGGRSPNRSDDAQQVKETLMSKSIMPSADYIELDPKGGFGTPVEISSKEDEQLADLIGEGICYEVDRRLTNIVSCHHKKWIGVHLVLLKADIASPLILSLLIL
nr:hypothetical protein Iba_chr12dCG11260 [Ipomoea batatas]